MSCNTPVTLLTNFRLVLGHTVTSIRILRFPETYVSHSNLDTTSDTIHCHVLPFVCLLDHGSSPPPTLSLVYSLSLASCFCPTLPSCVSHSCNITFLCFSLTLPIPLT